MPLADALIQSNTSHLKMYEVERNITHWLFTHASSTNQSKWIINTIKQTNITPFTHYLMLKCHIRKGPNDFYHRLQYTHSFISAGLCSDRHSQLKPPRPFPPGPARHRWLEGFFLSNLFFFHSLPLLFILLHL